jgi:large subunit ribosomal protein L13
LRRFGREYELRMGTYSAKPSEVDRKWWVVDATDIPLGRLASHVAAVLRGKHKPVFTPHVDTGDFVIVVNAERVRLTGNKLNNKLFSTHSGIPGGFKQRTYRWMLEHRPTVAIERAVTGMLPKGPLGRQVATKLKVYAGPTHPHAAQQPAALGVQQ